MPSDRFALKDALRFAEAVAEIMGANPAQAATFAESLVYADLRDIASHGLARLESYVGLVEAGFLTAAEEPEIVMDAPALALVDARNGLGQVAGTRSMELAIQKARQAGIGWVVTRHSNHYGTCAYYAGMALPAGMIGISATNSGPVLAPTFGRQRVLGTNPLAVAAPAGSEPPFLLDMATSAVAGGKLQIAIREGRAVPKGWGLDAEGRDCTDPSEILARGAMLPLGSFPELSSHKGYGLAMLVEMLTGVLGGGPFGLDVGNLIFASAAKPTGVSHMFAAVEIGRFMPLDVFQSRMDHWLRSIKDSAKAAGADRIYAPGEKEYLAEERNRREGFALDPLVAHQLATLARRLGIEPLSPLRA